MGLLASSILLFNKFSAYMNKGDKSVVHDFAPVLSFVVIVIIVDFTIFHSSEMCNQEPKIDFSCI